MIVPFKKISTWRERIGQTVDFPLHVPTDVERAMVAEIADLRAIAPIRATDGQAQTSAVVEHDPECGNSGCTGCIDPAVLAAQLADSTTPGAPERNGSEADQTAFEAWTKREGQYDLIRADDLRCEDGRFPATYRNHVTESCWRAWTNKAAAPTAQQSLTAGGAVSDLFDEDADMLTAAIQQLDGLASGTINALGSHNMLKASAAKAATITDAKRVLSYVLPNLKKLQAKLFAAAPLPQVQSEALDAARYRYVRDTGTLETAVWEALEGYGMTNETGELDQAAYARSMDIAIDRAIADHPPVTPSRALADNDGGVA